MNQWLAANRYRRYPFQQDAVLPFPDTVIVDALLVLSTKFAVTDVQLTSVTAGSGTLALVFSIGSSPLPGYTLEGTISTTAAEESRLTLAVKLSGVPHPELGYGVLMIGRPADAAVSSGSYSAKLDRSVIKPQVMHEVLTVRVANMQRAGQGSITFTPGSPDTTSIKQFTTSPESACDEHATVPTSQQNEMVPTVRGTSVTPIDVPPPVATFDLTAVSGTHDITATPAAATIVIPTLDATFDALVDVGPVASTIVIANGHNMKMSGDVSQNMIQFNYQLGAGLGMDCTGIKGYTGYTKSKDCVKSINGVYADQQELTISVDSGVEILPDQAGHRLILVVHPENLTRVAT